MTMTLFDDLDTDEPAPAPAPPPVQAAAYLEATADVSACGKYRYSLKRLWDPSCHRLVWIMLNPSIADTVRDDPTVRRCVSYAKAWGFGSIRIVNLFAFRSTWPEELKRAADPIGPGNDRIIVEACRGAGQVIAAWGAHGSFADRDKQVLAMLGREGIKLDCLATCKAGQPRHPLFMAADARPVPYTLEAA
jgi:hypothetical protein